MDNKGLPLVYIYFILHLFNFLHYTTKFSVINVVTEFTAKSYQYSRKREITSRQNMALKIVWTRESARTGVASARCSRDLLVLWRNDLKIVHGLRPPRHQETLCYVDVIHWNTLYFCRRVFIYYTDGIRFGFRALVNKNGYCV